MTAHPKSVVWRQHPLKHGVCELTSKAIHNEKRHDREAMALK
jgi:hypothetical protein